MRRFKATLRLWWRMMRQQRVTREGWFYVLFTLVVGAAAINTGNNLLYLVLGLQLSLMLLSAVLSESALRGVDVERQLPRDVTAGEPLAVRLVAHNRKRRFPSYSLVLRELEGPAAGASTLVVRVGPGESVRTSYRLTIPRRSQAHFGAVLVTTRFPFGLFEKGHEKDLPASLEVHPARAQAPRVHVKPVSGEGERPEPRPGQGRDFHSLREFRPGDDPRHVHWRSSARAGQLMVVERERERRRRVTIQVDARGARSSDALDGAAEGAAALARRYTLAGYEVGFSWSGGDVSPAPGTGHLRRILGAITRLEPARATAPAPLVHRGAQGVSVPLGPSRARHLKPRTEHLEDGVRSGQGKLTLRSAQRFAVFAAVSAAFASVAISGELPGWSIGAFVFAGVVGFGWGERSGPLLRHTSTAIAVGALLILGIEVIRGNLDVVLAAPAFAVALAGSRLVGRRGAVDDALLLLSGLLLLAGGAALTGDLGYGVCFALFAVAATVALCLTQLRSELERVEGPQASWRPGTASGTLVGTLGLLSVAALAGSALVFVAFPRVSAGMLHRTAPMSGVPERITLGGVGVLKEDPTPVLRVRFPAGEPPEDLYWRVTTFDRWDGRGWSRSPEPSTTLTSPVGTFRLGRGDRNTFVAEVDVLSVESALPVPGDPVSVSFAMRGRQATPIVLTEPDGTLQVRGAPDPLRYRVSARPRTRDSLEGLGRTYPEDVVSRYTQLPEVIDPRVRALAAEVAQLSDAPQIVHALINRLDRLHYTRELPGNVADPLASFLFDRKAGHCEFFASALAVLLRLNGIPARVVAGYYGVDKVDGSDYWVVRRGDSHAWTEVYFPGEGWVRFDATPAADRAGTAQGFYAMLVEQLDRARAQWASVVVDFDAGNQIRIAEAMVRALGGHSSGRRLSQVARTVVAVLAIIGAAFLSLRLRRLLRRERIDPAHREAVVLFRAVKKAAMRYNVTLPPGATAEEWARAGAKANPMKAVQFRRALVAYHHARFGGMELEWSEARKLRRSL